MRAEIPGAWERLLHAYGRAVDTPDHLLALQGDDEQAVARAFEHLWSAVLHQGTVYPATGPVVTWLCRALLDGRAAGPARPEAPTREAAILVFVAECFRSARAIEDVPGLPAPRRERLAAAVADYDDDTFWHDDELVADVYRQGLIDLRATAPLARHTATRLLAERAAAVQATALDLLVLATLTEAGADRHFAIRAAGDAADHADDLRARVTAILALGELGADTSPFLDDSRLEVRFAAALAPTAAPTDPARQVLADAVADPRALDAAFMECRPPQFDTEARFYAYEALARGARDFADLLPTAIACLREASIHTVDHDWGLLLVAARRLHPGPLTDPVRAYVAAIVKRKDLWDPKNPYARQMFEEADLPYDRKSCAALTRAARRR